MPFPLLGGAVFHGLAFTTRWAVYDPPANAFGIVMSDAQQHVIAFF